MKKVLYTFIIFVIVGLFFPEAFSQSYTTFLTLDPIPSQVSPGDTITFSGVFGTTDGYVIQDATIYIKDDVTFDVDTILGTVVTDENGEFVGTWEAQTRSGGGSYDFYAIYEGSSNFAKVKSQTFSVFVSGSPSSYSTSSSSGTTSSTYSPTEITLDKFPNFAKMGQTITFSGKLTSNGNGLANAIVSIKDEDLADLNDLLTSTTTDSTGKFSVNWKVKNVDSGDRQLSALVLDLYGGLGGATQVNQVYNLAQSNTVEIYAEFQGNNQYAKSNTCLLEYVDGVLQSNCYNNILTIQDDSSFENFIISMALSEMGVGTSNTDSLESILSNQADYSDTANFEDLLLDTLQEELDLGDTDLTMDQMLELLEDPSLAENYNTVQSYTPPTPKTTPAPIVEQIPYKDYDGDRIFDEWDDCIIQPETFNGYQDSDGCPDTIPKPNVPDFVEPSKGAQYYLDRYNNEPAYKDWFDRYYPDYSIKDAIEISIPDAFSVKEAKPRIPDFVDPSKGAQYYLNRYNNEPVYKDWFDRNYPDYTIKQAITLAIPDAFSQPNTISKQQEQFCFLFWCW